FEEYRARFYFGDKPALERYRERYPVQFPELQRLLDEELLREGGPSSLAVSSPEPRPKHMNIHEGATLPIGGGYKIVRLLARGSFADVWQAEAPGGFPAAVKVIRGSLEEDEGRRELEALRLLTQLDHPFLLKTQAAHFLENYPIIVMDLADESLRDR